MILMSNGSDGALTPSELDGLFQGATAILVGGAPSLRSMNLRLLEQRGVLSVAMNNAAVHFQPAMWISSDHPECFDPQIILDPRIMKFAPDSMAAVPLKVAGPPLPYHRAPNMFFYTTGERVDMSEWLEPRARVPWLSSTLMHSIYVLYSMGVRRIILAGSDFGGGPAGEVYAHAAEIGTLQKRWNLDLYNAQADEMRTLRPYFEGKGLQIMDASVHSRIAQVYPKVSLEDAVKMCLERFPAAPADTSKLPHCSQFAPEQMKRMVAGIKPASAQETDAHAAKVLSEARAKAEVYV